jgi:hypothetical protein
MSRGLAALGDQSPKDVPGPDNPLYYFFFFAAFFFVPFFLAIFFFAIAESPPCDFHRVGGGTESSRRDIPSAASRRP